MTRPTDERLDRIFSGLCSQAKPHEMPASAWPGVERRLPGPGGLTLWGFLTARPLLAPSCAALLIAGVLLWTHPGFAAEVAERIRRMFSGTFEFQVGDSKPLVKEVTIESGKPSSVRVADKDITFTLNEAGDGAVMTTIRITEAAPAGAGRLLAAPKVVTRKGSAAEVTITDSGSGTPLFRVKVVPTDAPGKVIGNISEVKQRR